MAIGLFLALLWSPLIFIALYFFAQEDIAFSGPPHTSFAQKARWPFLTLLFCVIFVIDPLPHFFGLPDFFLVALMTACYIRSAIELLRLLWKGHAKKRIVLALCVWCISVVQYSYLAVLGAWNGGITWP